MDRLVRKVTITFATAACALFVAGMQSAASTRAVQKTSEETDSSLVQEKLLYSTDFSDWSTLSASTKETTVEQTTKYSGETLVFTLYDTAVNPNGQNDKFNDGDPLGWLQAAKSDDPYVITSALNSITTVRYVHAATGSNRGWKLWAKGDGDDDWVVISETVASPAAWCEVEADINRTNVQLKWTNLNSSQNAYMFELDIYGLVDYSQTPTLGSFALNGTTYDAEELFDEEEDGTRTATVEITKSETMISEDNPLTDISLTNGELTSTTYSPADDGSSCTVTIVVSLDDTTKTYILTVKYKDDCTVIYVDTDGSLVGTQSVEQEGVIGAFAYGEDDVTVEDGQAFRGWFESADGGRKVTVADTVYEDLIIYAVATDIETESPDARYSFDLTDEYFYQEDHEAFSHTGTGGYYNSTHGWSIAAGDTIALLVGGHAYIVLGLCSAGSANTVTVSNEADSILWTTETPVSTDGETVTYEYDGDAGTLIMTCDAGFYLHNVTIINDGESVIVQGDGGFYIVGAGDADNLIATLEVANSSASDNERTYIFLPNGTYDLGDACLTTISGNNISLIGQSMDSTIIVNTPAEEGISITGTILITGENTYLQDLTLQNNLDYYNSGSAGRAVALHDKGTHTVCKNVKLLSYQDTYYTNSNSQFYWETSEIHGCVDYICGTGDAFFNNCLLVNESRSSSSKSGEATMTAPGTNTTYNNYGYVFSDCTIENLASSFNFGRAWKNNPRLAYINTTLNQPDEIASSRFTTAGMNVVADKFVEYNSMDEDSATVSPSSNVLTFTKDSESNTFETILTDDEAAAYNIDSVFTGWSPAERTVQVEMSGVARRDAKVTWDESEDAVAYAVFADDTLEDIVPAGTTSYTLNNENATTVTVRAANSYGGLGEGAEATETVYESLPAFPGAEGFGKYTTGGRGGDVYHVTTLEDTGTEGSFRYACTQSGARTIVFDVSGTIYLTSELKLSKGNVTIAGQTAPGDGICIADYPFTISADNVIIRYMRFRLGNRHVDDHEGDGLGGMDRSNIVIDHCSVSWSVDECLSVYGSTDITVQWCIASHSMVNAGHSKGSHGYGGNWGGSGASYHHNLMIHHTSRTPRLGPRPGTQTDERMDMRNNVIYNWAGNGCYGGEGMNVNIVNNYYKPGPGTESRSSTIQRRIASIGIRTSDYTDHDTDSPNDWDVMWHVWGKYYVDGNVNSKYSDVTEDNWTYGIYNQIDNSDVDYTYTSETKDTMRLDEPIDFVAVTTHTAEDAFDRVLDYAGCSLSRDSYDETLVSDALNGTATYTGDDLEEGFINSQDDCGGWPDLESTDAPADTDGDGMPDDWELANDLNPYISTDGAEYADNGYTNLENYLNSLVAEITEAQNDGGEVMGYTINEDGTTPIEDVVSDDNIVPNDYRIYTIDGRFAGYDTERLQKGIYIINRQKVVVN